MNITAFPSPTDNRSVGRFGRKSRRSEQISPLPVSSPTTTSLGKVRPITSIFPKPSKGAFSKMTNIKRTKLPLFPTS